MRRCHPCPCLPPSNFSRERIDIKLHFIACLPRCASAPALLLGSPLMSEQCKLPVAQSAKFSHSGWCSLSLSLCCSEAPALLAHGEEGARGVDALGCAAKWLERGCLLPFLSFSPSQRSSGMTGIPAPGELAWAPIYENQVPGERGAGPAWPTGCPVAASPPAAPLVPCWTPLAWGDPFGGPRCSPRVWIPSSLLPPPPGERLRKGSHGAAALLETGPSSCCG